MAEMDMANVLKPGQTLVIHLETKRDPLTVKLHEYHTDKETLVVYDASNDLENNNLENLRHIHLNECQTIKLVLDDTISTADERPSKSDKDDINSTLMPMESLQLTLTESARIKEQLALKPQLIEVDGKDYEMALRDIELQSKVSLVVSSNVKLFAIGTQSQVYIFDIDSFGEVPEKLKIILKTDYIKLIIHDSRKMYARVKNEYGLKLKGVVDTCVAYRMVTGCKQNCSLQYAIEHILQLKCDSLEPPPNVVSRIEYCQYLIKLAIYQRKLYERLVDDCLLNNYYETCQRFSRTIVDIKDDAQAAIIMAEKQMFGVQCIYDGLRNKGLLVQQFQNLDLDKKTEKGKNVT